MGFGLVMDSFHGHICLILVMAYGIGRESLEQAHSCDKEVNSLVTSGVVRVAAGV